MNLSIKVSSPEGMAGFLSQIDPFQDFDCPELDSGYNVGHRLARFMTNRDIKEGIDYIVQCEA